MKTSVDVSDPLLNRARELAAREGRSLRELIEEGLRMVLERHESTGEFRMRDASVGGRGLRGEFRYDDWGKILEASYERRP
jgi:hypothetical protein